MGELIEIEVELDVDRGYVVIPVPFFVNEVCSSRKQLNYFVRGTIKLKLYCTLLDLTQPETYFSERSKSIIVQISEIGQKPRQFNWVPIRKSIGSKQYDLIWAAIV